MLITLAPSQGRLRRSVIVEGCSWLYEMSVNSEGNVRPDPDKELVEIADYVIDYVIASAEAR